MNPLPTSEPFAPYPLDTTSDAFVAMIRGLMDRLQTFLDTLPSQPAQDTRASQELVLALREPPPECGSRLDDLFQFLFEDVIPCSFNTAGPGYLAYVPGGGLLSAALSDLLVAVVNRYGGVWAAAPGAAALETQALRWLAELMGFPKGSLGVFTTGGSMSNLLAVVAAREQYLGDDLRGARAYVSREVHHCVDKALRIAGIGRDGLRHVAVDGEMRLRLDDLSESVERDRALGLRPFFVCASAGTVNTGALDPLADIAEFCRREHLWLHVDGAYGAPFRLVPELAKALSGIERADSLALDPHKGFFLPYGTGVLLVRDMTALRRAFGATAAYMPEFQHDTERYDWCEVSPELSREWRGLRLWLPFKLHGVGAFRDALRQKHRLALWLAQQLEAEPDVVLAHRCNLSLFAFRQEHPHLSPEESNEKNRALLAHVNDSRRVMLTGTEIEGTFWLRACVLHLRTEKTRVAECWDLLRAGLLAQRSDASSP